MSADRLFPEVLQATLQYSGRVQGVGFRACTLRVAREFEVAGWVRNLADGRVQVVVEGEPTTVNAFLSRVSDVLSGHIRSTERSEQYVVPTLRDFVIR